MGYILPLNRIIKLKPSLLDVGINLDPFGLNSSGISATQTFSFSLNIGYRSLRSALSIRQYWLTHIRRLERFRMICPAQTAALENRAYFDSHGE